MKKNSKNSVGFIGSSEMLDISPKPIKFMVDDERVSDLHVKKGTVLISRSGTIGNISYVHLQSYRKSLSATQKMPAVSANHHSHKYDYDTS